MRVEQLLERLVCGLVDSPEEVIVTRFDEDDDTILLELSVAEDDYGKVIGRGGRTAQALRTVIRAAAGGERRGEGERRRVLLDIVD
ncbi:MAG: KH domain-containing protein [Solirubrobacteraceae bacterium]